MKAVSVDTPVGTVVMRRIGVFGNVEYGTVGKIIGSDMVLVNVDNGGSDCGPISHKSWHVVENEDEVCECAYVPGDSGHEFGCPSRGNF